MRSAFTLVLILGALAPLAAPAQTGYGGGSTGSAAPTPPSTANQPPATGGAPASRGGEGSGSLAASRSDLGPVPRISAGTFQSMDKNGDGFLTRDEAKGVIANYFDDLDKDKDGKLSPSEVVASR